MKQYTAYKIGAAIRKTLLMTITASATVSLYPGRMIQVSADQAEELKQKAEEAAEMLETNFDSQYNNILEDVKKLTKEKGWDYELTMMSFYDNENPFKSMDYTKLIAAYTTVKALAEKDSSILLHHMLTDVELITYTYEEETFDDGAKYGVITLEGKEPEYIFEYFGLSMDDKIYYNDMSVKDVYESKQKAIENAIFGVNLAQNLYIATRGNITVTSAADQEAVLNYLIENGISAERRNLIITAMTLLGQVPYEWGGKPDHAGMDTSWWLFDESGRQKGLDCSGYVQWAFMTAGYSQEITDKLLSTTSTVGSFEKIDKDELMPGDLGLFNDGYLSSNHVGIYVGDGKWIHCSSTKNTVVIAEDVGFNVFVRVIDDQTRENMQITSEDSAENNEEKTSEEMDETSTNGTSTSGTSASEEAVSETPEPESQPEQTETDNTDPVNTEPDAASEEHPDNSEEENIDVDSENVPNEQETNDTGTNNNNTSAQEGVYVLKNGQTVTEEDIYLLAQLVTHEARGEGVNGWAAVAEVVMNRVYSDLFPNTISDVVFQNGQFSGVSSIRSITPSDNLLDIVRDVVKGDMKIFDNGQVLYFRNPKTTSGIDASSPVDWGRHRWYTSIGAHAFYTQN